MDPPPRAPRSLHSIVRLVLAWRELPRQIPDDLLARAWGALIGWREALAEGVLLDVFNSTEGAWYLGKVVPLEEEEPDEEGGERSGAGRDAGVARPVNSAVGATDNVRIHYQGWPSK